jgi:hypothetical protein
MVFSATFNIISALSWRPVSLVEEIGVHREEPSNSRQLLANLVYIRPISEYVCEAWDNCGTCHSNKLEKIQLEAARIVTGLPNLQKLILYISKLAGNHYIIGVTRKHKLFYKIYNGFESQYLHDLIPLTIQSTTIYSLRNGSDLIVSFCRLSSTNSSFIPSSVREWNKLENTMILTS